jgi:hypothetical protein
MAYMVVDRNGEPLHNDPFPTVRKAREAQQVYEDFVEGARPYKVVKYTGQVRPEHAEDCQCEECVCPF